MNIEYSLSYLFGGSSVGRNLLSCRPLTAAISLFVHLYTLYNIYAAFLSKSPLSPHRNECQKGTIV